MLADWISTDRFWQVGLSFGAVYTDRNPWVSELRFATTVTMAGSSVLGSGKQRARAADFDAH